MGLDESWWGWYDDDGGGGGGGSIEVSDVAGFVRGLKLKLGLWALKNSTRFVKGSCKSEIGEETETETGEENFFKSGFETGFLQIWVLCSWKI